jgi:putative ABC transport system permease protein
MRVVGVARPVSRTADAWVLPSQIPELTPSGKVGGYQMFCRFISTTQYVDLKPGTSADAYVTALDAELKPLGMTATTTKNSNGSDTVSVLDSLTALLTLMLVCVAGFGVLGRVVLDTHERVHDFGIHKALGMTPRQTVTVVVTSVVLSGLADGALGVPLDLAVHSAATALRAE